MSTNLITFGTHYNSRAELQSWAVDRERQLQTELILSAAILKDDELHY